MEDQDNQQPPSHCFEELWLEIPPDKAMTRPEFEKAPSTPEEDCFRHSGWRNHRRQVFEVLKSAGTAARLDSFAKCGSYAVVEYSPSQRRYRIRANYCHDRFCQPCARARAARLFGGMVGLASAAAKRKRLKFLTLTLKSHPGVALQVQIERLLTHFKTLRNRAIWKRAVVGGVKVLEVKRGAGGGWHPHLHVLLDADYIDWAELKRTWWEITTDSDHVDIRQVKDLKPADDLSETAGPQQAVRYVCKYATKPCSAKVYDSADDLAESILALKGVRMFDFIGTWRNIPKSAEDELKAQPDDFQRLGLLDQIMHRARLGEANARSIIDCLCNGRAPDHFGFSARPPGP